MVGDAGADIDHGRMTYCLGHAGEDAGAARQLRQRVDHLGRRVGENPAQGIELVRLDGVHETREKALEHRSIHVRGALRGQDKPQAVMPPDTGDLPQHLGGDQLVLVRRDQVELVDGQDGKRDLPLPGEILQVARDCGGDDAQVAEQLPLQSMLTNAPGFSMPPSRIVADVRLGVEGPYSLLRGRSVFAGLHVQERRLLLDLGNEIVDAELGSASLSDLAGAQSNA